MCRVGDDYSEVLNDRWRTARKEHRCDECRRTIEPGESYKYEFVLWEGDASANKACAHCYQARRWLIVACRGWVYGEVVADLADHVTGDERELRTLPLTRLVRWQAQQWRHRDGRLRSIDEVKATVDDAIARFKAMLPAEAA